MINQSKDAWDKTAVISTVVGSLLLPIIVFVTGHVFTEQQKQAEAAHLAQQKAADADQRNADRIAVLLTHLASNNRKERLLAIRFVGYLIQNNLFPKELSQQELLLEAVEDEDATVAHAASHALTEAVSSNQDLKQSVEQAAENNSTTRRVVAKAAELSPRLKSYVNVDGIRTSSPVRADSPPAGATALCRDGTYSFSQNRRGTCSGHGGVARWL